MNTDSNQLKKIFIVEDSITQSTLMEKQLKKSGYNVTGKSVSFEETMEKIQENRPDLILMDINIDGHYDGIDTACEVKRRFNIPVVYITSDTCKKTIDRAMGTEPFGYITRPYDKKILFATIEVALKRLDMGNRLNDAINGTIRGISLTIEARDSYTAIHQNKVSKIAVSIAENMGLNKDQIEGIRVAGLIHDLGKIQIPSDILCKPAKLDNSELNLMKTHPRVGYDILKKIEFPWPIAQTVYQHHERIDGSGYPEGFKGDDIITEARVIGVADTTEAMISHRPYRPAMSIDNTIDELYRNRNILYDSDVAEACCNVLSGYKRKENFIAS